MASALGSVINFAVKNPKTTLFLYNTARKNGPIIQSAIKPLASLSPMSMRSRMLYGKRSKRKRSKKRSKRKRVAKKRKSV